MQIHYQTIKACSYAMSKEQTRYYLCGIHIFTRDGKLFCEATDGHRLIRVSEVQDNLPDFDAILDAETVNMIVKNFAKAQRLELIDGKVVVDSSQEYPAKFVDGTFPPTDRVIPDNDKPEIPNGFGFNLEFLDGFAKALKALGNKKPAAECRFGDSKASPMKMTARTGYGDFTGVIVPMRV